MRHVLQPGLARIRRDVGCLQLGLDPERALLLDGLHPRWEAAIRRSVPGGDLGGALRAAGAPDAERERVLAHLCAAGLLVDAADLRGGRDPVSTATRAPDRASAALVARVGDGGRAAMERRDRAWVQVSGAGRVGAAVAGLLAAAGIGHVLVEDDGRRRPADLPAGEPLESLGSRRGPAAERAAARSAPAVRHDPPPGRGCPDLVVVAPPSGWGRDVVAVLLAEGVAHLPALVVETVGVVGPLVVPGRTSCVRCGDLHRTDRDRGWPAVVDQCAHGPADAPCDATLAALVAAQAAQQAVALVDGWSPTTLDATLETALPGGLTRRRSWRPHPACGCRWDAELPA